MPIPVPEEFNLADHLLDARVTEGRGERVAIVTDRETISYRGVQALANRCAHRLRANGIRPEERVAIALPDGPEFAAVLFGTLKLGAVVVMVNAEARVEEAAGLLDYTRARAVFVHPGNRELFAAAGAQSRHLETTIVAGTDEFSRDLAGRPAEFENFPTHRDDAAIWLFSGGTTGRPKAVIQTHNSFANTTRAYAGEAVGYREDDATISVPRLHFGYATGCNLLFPFAAGARTVLFPEHPTAEVLFEKIERHRPTILVNVPGMVTRMLDHPGARREMLASLRFATSAGEALPVELHRRWDATFGVPLLDGLGTAEMWHIFITNRPGDVRPGTLGTVVPGFEVKVCDDEGRELAPDEVGWLWVRGDSRAIGYWHDMAKTSAAFRGEWYVSGDMVSVDAGGVFTYAGRGDDMLKVSGKWLSPREVEECLITHPAVDEVAVVGVAGPDGLVKPHAFVVARADHRGIDPAALGDFAREHLAHYKVPRRIVIMDTLPRTHLGKVDRGRLKRMTPA